MGEPAACVEEVMRRLIGATCLFLSVLFGLAGCGGTSRNTPGMTDPPLPAPTDTVSGTVMYKGAPLAGVTITEWSTNANVVLGTTTTDASGNYSFSGIQTTGNVPPELHFWATKAGYGFVPTVGSGAKATRADHTGQFQGTLLAGIYFNVIDYVALANGSLSGANFVAYDDTTSLVAVPATGQTTSYAAGDDGALQKGAAWPVTRFTDNADGTVTDALTGLIWLRDAGCLAPSAWGTALTEANQLASGTCGLSDGSKAGQWRLPNLDELESMVDASASNPVLSAANPFKNVAQAIYWSSTSYFGGQAGSPQAWAIRMSDGQYINDGANNLKTSSVNQVWAVKGIGGAIKLPATGMYDVFAAGDDGSVQAGVMAPYPRFIDNSNGTVTDLVTGLIWLKLANCIQGDWATAVAAAHSLASGQCGLTDGSAAGSWRMPNRNEMQSLSDRMQSNHSQFFNQTDYNANGSVFQAAILSNFIVSQYYWTSTTNATNVSNAWTVYSCDFGVYDTPKSNTGYTLAVR
jgi:Protein of unknown function (DUF1566)